ncbi:MAG: L,D-transpeptidase [Proteobacteria bacterium]|nr:L,D-transpeptidase [Pseudomonadota bacterium]
MSATSSIRSLLAGLAVASLSFAFVPQASAEDFWLWGGDEATPNSSGREVVRFNQSFTPGQVIVSFTDRKVYFITKPGEAISYPVAIPRDQDRWAGVMTVTQKRENPSWTPTPDMIRENPRLPRWVPGGHPMNPLGVRALYLGSSMYRIHGTDAPWTIGTAVSKGCIRMYNKDVLDLYPRVKTGAKVTVTWNSFKGGAAPVSSFENGDEAPQKPVKASRRHSAQAGGDRPVQSAAWKND